MIFEFLEDKDELLKAARGVSFRDVIDIIETQRFIDEDIHFNSDKYPNQRIYYVELKGYVYAVPYIKTENRVFLKTIYPSRKATRKFGGKK